MNREYAKFNQAREEYNPRVNEESHFSNYPDILIPSDYEEVGGDPIREQLSTLLLKRQTPPGTPPELEPGQAGCHIFQDSGEHYVAPYYQNKLHQRVFATKLILGNLCFYVPSFILLATVSAWRKAEHEMFENDGDLIATVAVSVIFGGVYIYFVGLFRNPPYIYMAFALRALITTGIFGVGSMLVCAIVLKYVLNHQIHQMLEKDNLRTQVSDTSDDETNDILSDKAKSIDEESFAHSPPYLGILWFLIEVVVQVTNAFLFIKYKYEVTDYRIPCVIYTVCYTVAPFLTTLALSNVFNGDPLGYDIFQILTACVLSSWHLMGTPEFLERLFKGKVCPLREDELSYALLHFGM